MIYLWNEIVKIEGSYLKALAAVSNGKYFKTSYGIYTDDNSCLSELEQLFAQYPRATLSMQSAFEYYELSDFVPDKYYIVTPYNSHTIKNKKVIQLYMDENVISVGREKINTEYGYIYIFNKERMLIELFRNKNKLPFDYFLEVVAAYRILKKMEIISLMKVRKYCKSFKFGDKLFSQIQQMI